LGRLIREGLNETTRGVGDTTAAELAAVLTARRAATSPEHPETGETGPSEPSGIRMEGNRPPRTPLVVLAAAVVAAVVAGGIWLAQPVDDVDVTGTTPDATHIDPPRPDPSQPEPSERDEETGGEPEPAPVDGTPTPEQADQGAVDLVPPDPGYEIRFGSVGDIAIGDALEPSVVHPHFESACGTWGPIEPTHNNAQPLGGLAADANSNSPKVVSIKVESNPAFRTASGVGVGTSLQTLGRVYGSDLKVDQADGWDRPTDGLLALYQPVAAIQNADQAITFLIDPASNSVAAIKVSEAIFWGDDEGCV
jgi:hypothetical protein